MLHAAVFRFGKQEGITDEQVQRTLVATQKRSGIAAHGQVSTLKICLGTLLGHDRELVGKLDEFVACCSLLQW